MKNRCNLLWLLTGLAMMSCDGLGDDAARIHVEIAAVTESSELQPIDGITSAGQPNAEQFALAAAAGYVAVVDIRGANEDRGLDEQTVLEDLGLDYVLLPVSSPDAISMENASELDQILADYDGPVLVHCGSGNRVGALLALRQSMLGADDAEALAYGKSAGLTGLEPVVRARLDAKE
jgi:uncharacterized protein (TIGR01244 family)